jgi:hypothetical protein
MTVCPVFNGLPGRRVKLLGYGRVDEDRKLPETQALPRPPRLPERAAIYIAPDGTVHFGALFEGLVPVADALGGAADIHIGGPPPRPEVIISPGSDTPSE